MEWRQKLEHAARAAKAQVIGAVRITHVGHAILVTTALAAFGDDPRATFFIEGLPPKGDIPRPDLILLHPDVGVLVIENKGIEFGDIHAVHDTCLTLTRDGRLKDEDPFHQAERVMYRLRDLCKQRFDLQDALFLRTAAFPRIRRSEFERRFQSHLPPETLFIDACTDPKAFKKQVLAYSSAGQRTARKTKRLTKRAHDQIMTILRGTALFHAPRRTFIDDSDPSLLGVQIQEMELALKEATQQQKDLGKSDLRGAHRLFRGVAGSGKSIMLALSVAQTLLAFDQEGPTLFASRPARRVLVVCFNKTLVHYLRNKIEDRYGRVAWDAPSAEVLTITHFEGLMKDLQVREPGLHTPLTFEQKDARAVAVANAFDNLPSRAKDAILFDAVYVDEAQDLLPPEIMLLRRLVRPAEDGGQTLILFYDNAQNIYGVTPPTWGDLGINIVGRTVFLDQCLRNTTETLAFAFNVLVGSFAPEGQKVATRQFADVISLKQRGLIGENGDRYEIHFSPRTGPVPVITAYPFRHAEIDGVAAAITALITKQKVLPSDILILYKSSHAFGGRLRERLQAAIGPTVRLRFVDAEHRANKNQPLIEEGTLTVSTIASAKGYDSPIVFLIGADELSTDPQGRASFYVGATRAKLCLYVSGVKQREASLLDEILVTAHALGNRRSPRPLPVASQKPQKPKPPPPANVTDAGAKARCRHCGSERLHAQHGKFGYFFRCIDCTDNTPIDVPCPQCGKKGRIRKAGLNFYQECETCANSEIIHTNVPLGTLNA